MFLFYMNQFVIWNIWSKLTNQTNKQNTYMNTNLTQEDWLSGASEEIEYHVWLLVKYDALGPSDSLLKKHAVC